MDTFVVGVDSGATVGRGGRVSSLGLRDALRLRELTSDVDGGGMMSNGIRGAITAGGKRVSSGGARDVGTGPSDVFARLDGGDDLCIKS